MDQEAAEPKPPSPPESGGKTATGAGKSGQSKTRVRRFHGQVALKAQLTGTDAGKIADEVISHLAGLANADVAVTLEISADLPDGASDQIVRTVTENCRTLRFESQGFERE